MSLKGNLSSVNLTEIFQMLSLSGREGTLFIYEGVRKRAICFTKEGVSIRSRERNESNLLGKILVRLGKIDESNLQSAIEERRSGNKLLGDVLVDRGACTRDDVEEAFRIQSEEDIQELFLNRSDAQFEYVDGYFPESETPYVNLNVNSLLIEIARRTDEWEYIRRRIRGPREIYRFTGVEGAVEADVLNECYAGRIDSLIDGSHAVGEIIDQSYVNKFEVCKLLAAYLDAGVIELVPPDAIRQSARMALRVGDAASAIRHYEYLMSTGDFALEVMGEAAEAHEANRDFSEAATLLRRLAEELVRAGDQRAAIDSLRRVANYPRPEPEALRYFMDLVFQNPRVAVDFAAHVVEAGKTLVAYYAKHEQRLEALKLLERLGKTFPDEVAFAVSLVNIHYEDGNIERAAAECEKLANSFLKRKRQSPAVSLYKKLLVIDPERHDIRDKIKKLTAGRRRRGRTGALPRVAIAFAVALLVGGVAIVWLRQQQTAASQGSSGIDQPTLNALLGRAVDEQSSAEEHGASAMEEYSKLQLELGENPLDNKETLLSRLSVAEKRFQLFEERSEKAVSIAETIRRQTADEEVAARARAMLASARDRESKVRAERARWSSAAQQAATKLEELGSADYKAGRFLPALERLTLARTLATSRDWKVERDLDAHINNITAAIDEVRHQLDKAQAREEESDWTRARKIYLDLIGTYRSADLIEKIRLPVEILSVPPGATILLDGVELPQKTPAIVRVSPFKETTVTLQKASFDPDSFRLGPYGADTEAAKYEHTRSLLKAATWARYLKDHVESAPVVWNGRVGVVSRNARWFVLDEDTGKPLHSDSLKTIEGVSAGLVTDGRTLFVPGLDGSVFAIDARTLKPLYTLPGKDGIYATPLIADGAVYVVDLAGSVTALDLETRRIRWRAQTPHGVRAAPVAQGPDLVVVSVAGDVTILDRKSGQEITRYRLDGTLGTAPAPVGSNDLVFGMDEGTAYFVTRRTGAILWKAAVGAVAATPPVSGRLVFFAPKPGELFAYDTASGQRVYTYRQTAATARNPVSAVNRIFFASGRTLSAFAPHADGYGLAWTFEAKGRILAGPVVHGDAVYIGDERGYVYRLEAKD